MSCRYSRLRRVTGMQRRLDDALTQNPARPTRLPRFGKTLTRLTSRGTAAPRESSHRATQAELRARLRSRLLMATLRAATEYYPAGMVKIRVPAGVFLLYCRKQNG